MTAPRHLGAHRIHLNLSTHPVNPKLDPLSRLLDLCRDAFFNVKQEDDAVLHEWSFKFGRSAR